MKVEGGCHCGAIQFEAEIDPNAVSVCHCTDCQMLSGAPYRASVPIKTENLKVTRGEPKVYVKVADSGNKRRQGFCADCGTPFYSTSDDDAPSVFAVRVGALKQRDQLLPKRQIWTRSAQSWIDHLADVPAFEGGPPPPAKK